MTDIPQEPELRLTSASLVLDHIKTVYRNREIVIHLGTEQWEGKEMYSCCVYPSLGSDTQHSWVLDESAYRCYERARAIIDEVHDGRKKNVGSVSTGDQEFDDIEELELAMENAG